MSLLKKIKDAVCPPVPEECREESYDAVLKTLISCPKNHLN